MGQTSLFTVYPKDDHSKGDKLAKIMSQGGSISNAYYVTVSDTIVYTKSSCNDSDKAYVIKANTCARVVTYKFSSPWLRLGIDIGGKTGYVKYAHFKTIQGTSTSAGYQQFTDTSTGTGKMGWTTTIPKGIGSGYVSGSAASYHNILEGGKLDESRIQTRYKDNIESEMQDTQEAATNHMIASTTEAASGGTAEANGTDDDVTYKYSIKVNPTYFYNINEHLSGTANGNFNDYTQGNSFSGINYGKLRNIFGLPYQFLPTTDCRLVPAQKGNRFFTDDLAIAGYEFVEKIVSRMPLLYITPGNTSFMGGSTENARTALIGNLDESWVDKALSENSLKAMLSDYTGKLYTIVPAYPEYFNYVNPMCRAGAIFLGLDSMTPGGLGKRLNGTPVEIYHWGINKGFDYTPYIEEEETEASDEDSQEIEENGNVDQPNTDNQEPEEQEDPYDITRDDIFKDPNKSAFKEFQSAVYYSNAIPFYINSEASFQDSFSNETTESSLSSTINALSDRAREIQFLLGTASNAVGEAFDKVDGTLSEIKEQINNIVSKVAGGNSIFTTIANSVKTIVSGGRMLFPQIWSNSQFTKSYSISIKLTTPSYDRFSWWLNIYVPLCHLMALVLPRSEYINSYTTPFLIKAFYKGMFNIDMGIITEMSFTRGKEGSWTKDGLPTVVDVTFSIQDLYTGMGMTSIGSMFKGTTLQNVSEMDYIANLCGININEPDIFRMVILWATFNISSKIADWLPNLSLNIGNNLKTRSIGLYNSLWGL